MVVLDASPLGLLTNTNSENPEAIKCAEWLKSLLEKEISVCVPEIADYEIRRSLLKIDSVKAISRLDDLNSVLIYQPITTDSMREASKYWAKARKMGKPTADDKSLDADMILIGQVTTLWHDNDEVIIATSNIKHIDLFADARQWKDIDADHLKS